MTRFVASMLGDAGVFAERTGFAGLLAFGEADVLRPGEHGGEEMNGR